MRQLQSVLRYNQMQKREKEREKKTRITKIITRVNEAVNK